MASMCDTLFSKFDSPDSNDPASVGPEERWLSTAAGACLAGYGLSRTRLGALMALGAGVFLVYRGATGRCPLRGRLSQRSSTSQRATGWERNPTEGPWQRDEPQPPTASSATVLVAARSPNKVDNGDEAMMESFPASDPPSYTGNAAAPSVRIE